MTTATVAPPSSADEQHLSSAVEQHILPRANIDRMVLASLPLGSKSSIDSKVVIQYLASEFLAFVTSEADAMSKEGGRRFITVDDLLHALRKLGLGMYADAVGGLANLPPAEKEAAPACPIKPTAVAFSSPVSSNKRACAWAPSRPSAALDLNEAFDGKRPKRSALDELALGAPGAEETRPPPSGPRADAAEAASAIEQRQIESMLAADPGLLNELDDSFLEWVTHEFLEASGAQATDTSSDDNGPAFDLHADHSGEGLLAHEDSDLR